MSTTTPSTSKLELRTALGPVYRTVLTVSPRDCTDGEIPIIDISRLFSENLDDRKALAKEIYAAGVNEGFSYIKNHGISEGTIASAKQQAWDFFHQDTFAKEKACFNKSKYFNGYRGSSTTRTSIAEPWDVRESFSWRYAPQDDPIPKLADEIPEEVKPWIQHEEFVWKETSNLSGFKEASLAYWAACLTLARRLVKIFALALDLPENYLTAEQPIQGQTAS